MDTIWAGINKWTVRYCLTKKTFKVWLYIIISKVSVDLISHCFTGYKMYNNEYESRFSIHKRFKFSFRGSNIRNICPRVATETIMTSQVTFVASL